eukprot:gene8251-75_t
MKIKQVRLNSGSIFLQTSAEEKDEKKTSSGEKTIEEIVEEECIKRNICCKVNPKKTIHPSWKLRIKKDVHENELLKKGWKGTRTNFTQIGNSKKALLKEEIMKDGKKVKDKREHFSKRKKLKKTKGLEWTGNRIEF